MTMRKVVLSALFVTASALALNAQKISDVQKKISENKYTEARKMPIPGITKRLFTTGWQKTAPLITARTGWRPWMPIKNTRKWIPRT